VGGTPYSFYGATVPHEVYMVYQMMFAIITLHSSAARSRSG